MNGTIARDDRQMKKQEEWPKTLMGWFEKNKRAMPWREDASPYRILVSEVMLQQTQVVTVIPYFHRFMHAFPTVGDLASAPEEKILKLW